MGAAVGDQAPGRFAWGHGGRAGPWSRATGQPSVRPVRAACRLEWANGRTGGCPTTAAPCREGRAREAARWPCVRGEGREPTPTAAERQLRQAVQGRKVSSGTPRAQGRRFVAPSLTGVATGQPQGRNVLTYLPACCQAFYSLSH